MFHVSPIALNPQPQNFLFPFLVSPSRNLQLSLTLQLPSNFNNLRSPSTPQYHDFEDHVIGDCVVFEDGIFHDPHLNDPEPRPNSRPRSRPRPNSRKKVEENLGDNLVPDKWREIQAEINITKKERRKIAREIEFNRNVDKKRRGLVPLRDLNLEEYKAYNEAKLGHMKLLYNASSVPTKQDEPQTHSNGAEQERHEEARRELNGGERVKPKNPRWAVYGRGLEDVTEFFNSLNYDPDATNTPQGMYGIFVLFLLILFFWPFSLKSELMDSKVIG